MCALRVSSWCMLLPVKFGRVRCGLFAACYNQKDCIWQMSVAFSTFLPFCLLFSPTMCCMCLDCTVFLLILSRSATTSGKKKLIDKLTNAETANNVHRKRQTERETVGLLLWKSWERPSENLRVIVGNDPWKDWILHQVVVWTSSECIQTHQVLKVADFSSLPQPQRSQHILLIFLNNIRFFLH